MNILEQADKYAEGKANEAITKAIADAYIEGYKAGYKDREEEIPMELRDNKTEYIDLGLPSRTLWSTDYEKLDGDYLYLPYEKAEYLKIPTKEQWEELKTSCKWEYDIDNLYDFIRCRCVGPNGQILKFERTGRIITEGNVDNWEAFFWIEDDSDLNEKNSIHMFNYGKEIDKEIGKCDLSKNFSGYKLPVRLVR